MESGSADTNRGALPLDCPHADARREMFFEVLHEHIDNLWMRVPSLEETFMCLALEVLLTLFVNERAFDDCPEPPLGGKVHRLGEGYAKGGGGVAGKVDEEVEEAGVVGAEVERRGGYAVGFRKLVGGAYSTTVHDSSSVLAF